jgi:hypothetical protein
MLGLGQLREKGGKNRPLVDKVRPVVKYNPRLLYEIVFCLGKQGFCVGSPTKKIKAVKSFLMLCQTRIVFGDEYSAMNIPNARNGKRETKPEL